MSTISEYVPSIDIFLAERTLSLYFFIFDNSPYAYKSENKRKEKKRKEKKEKEKKREEKKQSLKMKI